VNPFGFALRTRLVFGAGAIDRLGELARELGARRVFVVTDPGIVAAGHPARAEAALAAAGCEVRHYEDVHANPTSADVARCREALGGWHAELIVGLGGGSSIDVAKGCAFVHAGGGRMEDYWGIGKARGTLLPLIAVPTTAGTGSETQSFALIEQEGTHQKMACGDPQAAARIALLDPQLTITQPPAVTACTGLDTIGHAVETAVTRKRSPLSELFSRESFTLAQRALPRVLDAPRDPAARGEMLLAAAYGGIAIENSMLGAAHSMANPLTARYDLAHGQVVGMMLPHVVRFNAHEPQIADAYARLALRAGLCAPDAPAVAAVEALLAKLGELLTKTGFAGSLAAHGVPAAKVDELAAEAARQWTAQFNPRAVTAKEFGTLFAAALA
jgi:alcohol dehydrogenase